tara:strand:- start:1470 stop:2864 length:1395 start_codon:yes stop_codon:yes gene_type:complete
MTDILETCIDTKTVSLALEHATAEYVNRHPQSKQMFERACKSLPGGNTRTGVNFSPFPLYADHGEGPYLYDLDGHRLLDFVNNATSLILGHADPDVVSALQEQVARGTAFSRPMALEVEMAEFLRQRMPTLEKVRFCSSGTEAVLNCLRVARAYTGKNMTAKFEGAYHGVDDHALVSYAVPVSPELGPSDRPRSVAVSEGLNAGVTDNVLVLPFNDPDATEKLIDDHADQLASIIIDPISTAAGLTHPVETFLPRLREITKRKGILLIFDEIVSFRASPGGAHTLYEICPDLICLGKVVAGGTAGALFGGRENIMTFFDPSSGSPRIWQSGTFNANPIALTAGLVTLQKMTGEAYNKLDATVSYIGQSLQALFNDMGIKATVVTIGSLFRVYFLPDAPRNYREAAQENSAIHQWLFLSLINRGIYWRNKGICGISLPTERDHVDILVEAVRDTLSSAKSALSNQ